jgi:hypothetical protein
VTFNGSDDAEVFEAVSLGSRFGLARDIGFVFTDVGSVEQLDVHTEPLDTLAFAGNGGDDMVDTTGLGPDTIRFT